MSSTHGKVIEREDEWSQCRYRHLEMSDGTYAAIPAGMVCEVGQVVAVLNEAEFCVVEIYRELMKENVNDKRRSKSGNPQDS